MRGSVSSLEAAKTLLLIIACSGCITEAQIYEMQGSGEIDTETYLNAELPSRLHGIKKETDGRNIDYGDMALDVMSEYSVCVSFLIYSYVPLLTIYNYFTEIDTIVLGIKDTRLFLRDTRELHYTAAEFVIYPDVWYQVCVVATRTRLHLYQKGSEVSTFTRSEQDVPLGGVITVAQDQDTPGGNFSADQAFRGQVANFRMWSRALSLKEVNDVANCIDVPNDLLPWGTTIWHEHGRVHIINGSDCPHISKQYIPFWEQLDIGAGEEMLKSLGMALAAPNSRDDIQSLVHLTRSAPRKCIQKYATQKYVLINALYNKTIEKLINMNNYTTLNVDIHYLHPGRNKSGKVFLHDNGAITLHNSGAKYKGCFLGEYFSRRPIFRLHSLCELDDWESEYKQFVVATSARHPFYFTGMFGEMIIQLNATWYVKHRYKNITLASLESVSMPLGRKEWNVTGKDPDCTFILGSRNLVFSICNKEEFTCNDGSCVPLSCRCNLAPDCKDWSDEHYCQTVSLPDGYLAHLPPPPPINFTFNIAFSHVQLDLMSMTFTMKMDIHVKWHEGRIDFLNLLDGKLVNEVSKNGEEKWMVWVPKLQMSDVMDYGPFSYRDVFVLKQTNGTHFLDGIKYPGATNSLIFVNRVMPRFNCPLDLRKYPRDSQQCNISITITNVRSENLQIVNYTGQYLGEKNLNEYEFSHWWLNSSDNTVHLSFQLLRCHQKHVWTTIVPTTLLMLISYGTLFIPVESFSDRGTMSLTTLLVLVSLYTETLTSLPATSYNKKAENWYILIIVYVSLIISVHLVTSNTANEPSTRISHDWKEERWAQKVSAVSQKRRRTVDWWIPRPQVLLRGARVVFGIMAVTIVLMYHMDLF